jgi:predicted phosphodiesterase
MGTKYRNHKSCSTGQGNHNLVITRRAFLKTSAATLAGLAIAPLSCTQWSTSGQRRGIARFGIVTDSHYADADTIGSRYYRHSLDKMNECVELMNEKKVNFLIELGDFKDQNNPPVEQKTITYLRAIEEIFQRYKGPTYHVLGNHDMDSISKEQFLTNVKNTNIAQSKSYYSFDFNGVHFVVLDANYKSDGTDYDHGNFNWTDANIPPAELNWLRQDLAAARARYCFHSPATRWHRLSICQQCRGHPADSRAIGQGHGSLPGPSSRGKLQFYRGDSLLYIEGNGGRSRPGKQLVCYRRNPTGPKYHRHRLPQGRQ